MRKKAISLVMALAMCLGMMAVPASAEEWNGDFTVSGDMVRHYYGDGGAVTVPSGYTKLEGYAFNGCENVTSITIPEGFTTIGDYAFINCTNLTSVSLPSTVTTIGDYAFTGTKLTSLTFPSGLTSLGDLISCPNLTSLTIPDSVTTLGRIMNLDSLTSVTLPKNLTTLNTISNCPKLTSLTIPSSVTTMYPINDCDSLTSLTLPSGLTAMGGISSCGSLTSLTIPSGVKSVSVTNCPKLTSINVPAGALGVSFSGCTGLTDIYYGGTSAQWKYIKADVALTKAKLNPTVHYNSTGPSGGTTQPTTPTQPSGATASNGAKVSSWAKDRVNEALSSGLAPSGLGTDYQANITRAQFAAAAVKLYEAMSGQTVPAASSNPFSDTTDPEVLKAAAMGFVGGVGGGKFDPSALLTREQAAVMFSAVYTKLGGTVPTVNSTSFADNSSVSSWARNAVAFMSKQSIISGTGNNNFSPKGQASIEQSLLISLGMLEKLK